MSAAALLRFAQQWLLPPGVAGLVRETLDWTRSRTSRDPLVRTNGELHGRHAGQRVFILCSGPSVKSMDLKRLRGEICIGVANFFVHPDYAHIAPRYHCIAPLHPPFTDENALGWFRAMETPLAGRELFVGRGEHSLIAASQVLAGIRVRYLELNGLWPARPPQSFPLDRRMPTPQSVSIMALMLALGLGFSEIYLIGADHTSVDFTGGRYDYAHFYTGTKPNALGELAAPVDFETEFTSYTRLWRQYKVLRETAVRRGVRIANAGNGGLLDVFPRVELASLLR